MSLALPQDLASPEAEEFIDSLTSAVSQAWALRFGSELAGLENVPRL